MTLDDLEGLNSRNAILRKKSFYGAHQKKNLNEDRPTLSASECRSM